jgi:PPM family protein phosphatase
MAENDASWNNFLDHAALSDVGLRRSNNQDSYAVVVAGDERDWRERGYLFMVADGMGAHAAGELASNLACKGVPHTYHKLLDRAAPDALRQAIIETNAHIHGRGEANAEFHGMGTTCSVLVLLPQGAVVGQVGDSRIYRLRNRRLDQLTFDHSLLWEMMASGQIPEGNAVNLVPKNIITRSLGPHAEVKVDLEGPFPLQVGDTFMICSDGLSGQVRDDQIGAILGSMSPQEAVRALIDLANLNGGPDNITVIVCRVVRPLAIAPEDRVFRAPAVTRRKGFSLHPAVWVTIGVALLIAVGLAVTHLLIAAGASFAVAVVAALVGLMQSYSAGSAEANGSESGPLGKGPHTTRDCTPTRETVRDLAQFADKLQEAARDQHWNVDWARYKAFLDAAQAAQGQGDFSAAVRQTLLAVSFMMNEIRHLRPKSQPPNSSSVLDR